jgi:hypothetical protein
MRRSSKYIRTAIFLVLTSLCATLPVFSADTPKKDVKKDAPAPAVEMAPIEIKLPPPYFGGTPINYNGEHFEGRIFTQRPPFPAPKGAVNLSQGRPVTGSDADPTFGKLSMITDGEKGYQNEFLTELAAGKQWIQVDLGQQCDIYAIICWHYHSNERVYFDVVVRTADDSEFTKYQTLYNNDYDNSSGLGIGKDLEYLETNEGRLISALKEGKGTPGRYVRLYSKGNTTDDTNHYVEVEVWGKPAGK